MMVLSEGWDDVSLGRFLANARIGPVLILIPGEGWVLSGGLGLMFSLFVSWWWFWVLGLVLGGKEVALWAEVWAFGWGTSATEWLELSRMWGADELAR